MLPEQDPYPSTPGEEDLRLSEVRSMIMSSPLIPDELKGEIANRASEFVDSEIRQGRSERFYGYQLGWTHYVIRNDHLDLVAALAPAASSLATYATVVSGANPITLAVTLIFAVAAASRKLRAKSASLDLVDYKVLMALKQIGPVLPLELANSLNGLRIYGRDMWNEERVLEVLRRLKIVQLGDGSVESFVTELPDGQWNTNGV
jgi:hypothetical protein